MKKIFTTIIIVSSLATAAFSQEKGSNELGVNVGYNVATVTRTSISNSGYRSGFNAGISLDHYFSESWSIKGRLIYDQKGWASNAFGDDIPLDYHLNYLTVPVLANWHFGRTKNWYLQLGPYAGFLLNAKEITPVRNLTDIKEIFNSTDIGLDVGFGVKFSVSDKIKLFIELNGQGGGTHVFKDNTISTIKNRVSSFNVGFAF